MQAFRFSDFEFEPLSGRLYQAGVPVPLRPQPAALLALLLKERHRVLEKQEILDTIWRDTYVQDQSLFQSIAELRKSLGDSAREPLFIKTVARRGYRWIDPSTAEVEIRPPADPVDEPARAQEEPSVDEPSLLSPAGGAGGSVDLPQAEPAVLALPELDTPQGQPRGTRLIGRPLALALLALLVVMAWGGSRILGHRSSSSSRVVAILPFVNATGDIELDWVAYGLMDLVSRRLEDHKDLSIIGADQIARTEADLDDHPETGRHGAWATGLRQQVVVQPQSRLCLKACLWSATWLRQVWLMYNRLAA
jgi:DNA-binding winged helix-turn-helix (wHTH) protein